jgi:hypothetical protein
LIGGAALPRAGIGIQCRKQRTMKTRTAIILLLSGYTLITTGGLFKIMHWPGANMQLLVGACIQVIALITLVLQVARHNSLRDLLER